jgi:hypothetical protein
MGRWVHQVLTSHVQLAVSGPKQQLMEARPLHVGHPCYSAPQRALSAARSIYSPQAVMALSTSWLVQLTASRPDWKIWLDVAPASKVHSIGSGTSKVCSIGHQLYQQIVQAVLAVSVVHRPPSCFVA